MNFNTRRSHGKIVAFIIAIIALIMPGLIYYIAFNMDDAFRESFVLDIGFCCVGKWGTLLLLEEREWLRRRKRRLETIPTSLRENYR
jgi:hypothetical protein